MKKTVARIALLLWFITGAAHAQTDTLRIATYNLLNFDEFTDTRLPYFRTVVHSMNPDLLIVQELVSEAAQNRFLEEVLNSATPGLYLKSPFIQGSDTNNSLFYKNENIALISTRRVRTTLRDISQYTLQVSGVEFKLYSLHLKAGFNDGDQNQRRFETTILRNHLNELPAGSHFIVGGDFNISGSSESAFLRLTESQADNDGRLFDPLNAIGTWNNNPLFARIHTQSTRDTVLSDDGSAGGLDDRFDMLLISNSIRQKIGMFLLPDSYTAFGNDGRHFNLAINDRFNLAVADSVADALFWASDHLPVYADFVIDLVNSVEPISQNPLAEFMLSQNYPNPFNAQTQISYSVSKAAKISLKIFNVTGQEIRTLLYGNSPAGTFRIIWDGQNDRGRDVASGLYFYKFETKGVSAVRKLILLR
ncbi:MAG: FlgD immunoglobulin-like domain containing protein [bacterium]